MIKFLTRSLFFISIMLMTVFFKEDTLSGYRVADWAYSVSAGDLDLDGFADILVGSQCLTSWGGISILKNMGWGSFQLTDSVFSRSNAWFVKLAQLDNDPHPEMIFLKDNPDIPTEYIGIIFNDNLSDSLFLDTHTYDGIECLATGDIDANGHDDIVFASNKGRFWGVFYRYGNISCPTPQIHHVTQYDPTSLDCKDLNNDGRADVVLCGQLIDVYLSTDTGFINLHLDADGFMDQVQLVDMDLDGYRDIVATKRLPTYQSVLLIYKNLGNNTFQRLPDTIYNIAFEHFFIADFNNDGLPDILFSLFDVSYQIGYHLLYNKGDFQFIDSLAIPVQFYGEWNRSCYCLDLDNNGYADIITTRWDIDPMFNNVDIQFNDGQGHFQPDPIVGLNNPQDGLSSSFNAYPNPCSSSTIIYYKLVNVASKSFIRISDNLGRMIKKIPIEKISPGIHKTEIHLSDLAPGTYLFSLVVNDAIAETKKMAVIR